MRIGLDLDNTIVCYDELFVHLAAEQELLASGQATDKTAVRNLLRAAGREDAWTLLQGLAYGPRMGEARPFDGVPAFLDQARRDGVSLCIISHRSRRPYAGPAYDLHAAARNWLALHGLDWIETHLETSREAKFARIAAAGCDVFVDDLPEFLGDAQFPSRVRRVLFDPAGGSDDAACRGDGSGLSPWKVVRSWPQMSRWIVTPAA
jgi:hypothetical protein